MTISKFFKSLFLLLCSSIVLFPLCSTAQTPAPGSYYFVSDSSEEQFYSDAMVHQGGIALVKGGMSVLATLLGDDPNDLLQPGQTLVPQETFDFLVGRVQYQPFAYTVAGTDKKLNLPIGENLTRFLNDPLGGASFDLTLPFNSLEMRLGSSGFIRRPSDGGSIYHVAADLSSTRNDNTFEVVAAADGFVRANPPNGSIVLQHTASNEKIFFTFYQHLTPGSKSQWSVNETIQRGALIGTVDPVFAHVHFGVAVQGPSGIINGVTVPARFYSIDPFGVYDYRRNMASTTDYNYLPQNTIFSNVQGIKHAYVFRTNPPAGSVLLDANCTVPSQYYFDNDHDGIGSASGVMLCTSTPPEGFSRYNCDIDDNDPSVDTGRVRFSFAHLYIDECTGEPFVSFPVAVLIWLAIAAVLAIAAKNMINRRRRRFPPIED